MPVCSNCGGSDFVWAENLRTGSIGRGTLSLRSGGELALGTRVCRGCGHADLFVKDPTILRQPHTWKPGEFVPIPPRPAAEPRPVASAPPARPEPVATPPSPPTPSPAVSTPQPPVAPEVPQSRPPPPPTEATAPPAPESDAVPSAARGSEKKAARAAKRPVRRKGAKSSPSTGTTILQE